MKFDLVEEFGAFLDNNVKGKFDWVTSLPVYQDLYNTTHHKSLGNSKVAYGKYVCISKNFMQVAVLLKLFMAAALIVIPGHALYRML